MRPREIWPRAPRRALGNSKINKPRPYGFAKACTLFRCRQSGFETVSLLRLKLVKLKRLFSSFYEALLALVLVFLESQTRNMGTHVFSCQNLLPVIIIIAYCNFQILITKLIIL